jgi:hypothetical protein
MGSQLVAVRAGLVTALDALSGFNGVQVSYAYKKGREPREAAWTVDGRVSHSPAGLRAGKKFRDEVGTFTSADSGPWCG